MKQKPSSGRRRSRAPSILRLPDLEHAPAAALNSLTPWGRPRSHDFVTSVTAQGEAEARDCVQHPPVRVGHISSFFPFIFTALRHSPDPLAGTAGMAGE